jgi:hypothetical protein
MRTTATTNIVKKILHHQDFNISIILLDNNIYNLWSVFELYYYRYNMTLHTSFFVIIMLYFGSYWTQLSGQLKRFLTTSQQSWDVVLRLTYFPNTLPSPSLNFEGFF